MTRQQERLLRRYGPRALVTGASTGIGREIAVQLAAAGFDLVLVARRETLMRELATDLTGRYQVDVRVLPLDLTLDEDVQELISTTAGADIGLYVAAAGFGTSGPFLDADLDQERAMLRLNCEAVLTTTLVLGRRMADRGRGGIILMSSVVGFQGMPNAAHYAATKAYVQTLAEALHVELRLRGVECSLPLPAPPTAGSPNAPTCGWDERCPPERSRKAPSARSGADRPHYPACSAGS